MAIDFLAIDDQLHRWCDDDGKIDPKTVKGSFTVFGFRILSCPQFDDARLAKEKFFQVLLRQKSFLDTIGSILIRQFDAAVELRAIRKSGRKTIDLALLFRVFTPSENSECSSARPLQSVLSVLPSDYEYSDSMPADELREILTVPANSKIVCVRKRLSYLPTGDLLSPKGFEVIAPLLSSIDIDKVIKPGGEAVAVPAVEYLSWNENNWLTVWRIMQESHEEMDIAIRLSLGSVAIFPFERLYTNQAMMLILRTYGGFAKYDYDSYVRSLSKFSRPNSLYSSQVQVACGYGVRSKPASTSSSELEAMESVAESTVSSVAHALSSEMSYGGLSRMSVFETRPNEIRTLQKDWELCRHTYPDDLEELKAVKLKENNKTERNFLLRAPFIVDEIEAATLFRLPIAGIEGLPGIYTRPPKPFYQPNPKEARPVGASPEKSAHLPRLTQPPTATDSQVNLGRVIINHLPREYHQISADDLTRHALIVGATGSGKTNSTLNLLINLAQSGTPFLVIEPVKGEYAPLLRAPSRSGLRLNDGEEVPRIFTFDFVNPWQTDLEGRVSCNRSFLRFNPLIVPPGITVAQHISFIKSCICAAFPMYGAMPLVLEIALRNLYEKKWDLFYRASPSDDPRLWPTLSGLHQEIENYAEQVKHKEVKEALQDQFLRRFTLLLGGVLGFTCDVGKWFPPGQEEAFFDINISDDPARDDYLSPLDVILSRPSIVELEALADDDEKALVMAFLLTLLYERRIAQKPFPGLKHVTVIEEAHRLLSNSNITSRSGNADSNQSDDSRTKAIQTFMNMLAEIRAYGEGIVIVEQIPTKLISDAIKNTNLKIMHRITSHEDREYLGEAMNFDEQQKKFVSSLRRGEAVIFEEHLDYPVLVQVDPRKA